jgi:hypothetical protein
VHPLPSEEERPPAAGDEPYNEAAS